MPAVGVPVTLRILSAPEPREHRPRSWMPSTMLIAFLGSISRICRLARVVTWAKQPAHIGLLGRRAVEQAEEAPAEIVVGLGRFVGCHLGLELLIGVERMLLALKFLLVGELAAG